MYWLKDESFSKMKRSLRVQEFCSSETFTNKTNTNDYDDLLSWGVVSGTRRTSPHIALFTHRSALKKEIKDIMEALKLKYKVYSSETHLKDLSNFKKGRYFVFLFENMRDYYGLNDETRKILDDYCRKMRAGIVGLAWPGENSIHGLKTIYSVSTQSAKVQSLHIYNETILRVIKPDITFPANIKSTGFSWFSGYLEVLAAFDDFPVALHEPNQINGVQKIIIARASLVDWIFKTFMMESIQFLSNNKIKFPLTRFIQIDIDDIFVGSARLTKNDVIALVKSQNNIAKMINGFRYNLGYSGSYFEKGTSQENVGDQLLIEFKNKFLWFPHMWRHIQPHKFSNITEIISRMQRNKNFAVEKEIDISGGYSVAPHHSGVYPVHEQLYSAWEQVWDIKVTSTEEYPSLYPARRRRGFIYRNVSVLPRQTCGLFTKNLYYDEYPGGASKIEQSIAGGELFETILLTPFLIFMTHMPNYCCDRLAPYLFESVLNFITCYTNIKLKVAEPKEMAHKYFTLFPEERRPVWTNPCNDRRHLEIYSQNKSCNQLPNMLIVGPQKTGSTALYAFLKLHPNIVSNEPSPKSYEELQFFNEKNYYYGLDWYRNFFPVSNSSMLMFEKSATYFDSEFVPQRVLKLLPAVKIVIIILPPEDRAYSWYHHMIAHDNPTAQNYTFEQVVKAPAGSPKDLLSLKSRCLEPGKYAIHLNKWLTYFRPKQIYILDGMQLKKDPVLTINRLQSFLQVPFVDYKGRLIFDSKKGFYCARTNGRKKCLGKGKGREYPPLGTNVRGYLRKFYEDHNKKLTDLLTQHGYSIPPWLVT